MRVDIYLRVSTKGQDLEPQRARLAAFAAERRATRGAIVRAFPGAAGGAGPERRDR